MSIIVAARNEADNLPALLASLLQQTHPHYEVVIVDDGSEDATRDIVQKWQEAHGNLRLLPIETPQAPRKKHALTQGIAAASCDLLAFTDADCTPPPEWLATLARCHAQASTDMVLLGYSPFERRPGLINRLARYETFLTGFLTAAAVGLGRPYMAVGRNISYGRAVFQRINGFAHSEASMSGDDDLLVQEVVRHGVPAQHVFEPETFVESKAPDTWRVWLRQKMRHLSASRYYQKSVQVHLAVFQATNIALWLAPFFLGSIGLGLLVGKMLTQRFVLARAATVFHERDLLTLQPLLELLYTLYNLLIAPIGILRTPRRW